MTDKEFKEKLDERYTSVTLRGDGNSTTVKIRRHDLSRSELKRLKKKEVMAASPLV